MKTLFCVNESSGANSKKTETNNKVKQVKKSYSFKFKDTLLIPNLLFISLSNPNYVVRFLRSNFMKTQEQCTSSRVEVMGGRVHLFFTVIWFSPVKQC